jgi:hypothetical protein
LVQVLVQTPPEPAVAKIAPQCVCGVEQIRPIVQNSMHRPAFGGARLGSGTQRVSPWLEVRVVSHCAVTSIVLHGAPDSRSDAEQIPDAALPVPTSTWGLQTALPVQSLVDRHGRPQEHSSSASAGSPTQVRPGAQPAICRP